MGSPLSWDLAVTEVPSKSMALPISRGEGPLRGITPRESAIKQLENFFLSKYVCNFTFDASKEGGVTRWWKCLMV